MDRNFHFYLIFSWLFLPVLSGLGQTLVLDEQFDAAALDREIWQTQPNYGPNINPDIDAQTFLPDNVEVGDGKLSLVLKDAPGCYDTWRYCSPEECNPGAAPIKRSLDPNCAAIPRCEVQGDHCLCLVPKYFKYTAGMVISRNTFHYGIFEVRCKIPPDCFPAFWLAGEGCEEIDIFEFMGCSEDNPTITIHECPRSGSRKNMMCGKDFKEMNYPVRYDFSKEFHTWKLDWKPESITIFVDGTEVFRCKRDGFGACLYHTTNMNNGSCFIGTSTMYPSGKLSLILNIATNPNDCTPPTPSVMEVDYVKVWQYE